jgi:hypothetical protein
MAKLTLSEAARACNVARTTIQRAVKTGRLSLDAEHRIDTAELLRVGYQLDAAVLHAASQQSPMQTQQQLTHAQQMLHEMQHRYDRLLAAPNSSQPVRPELSSHPEPRTAPSTMDPRGDMRRRIVALLREYPEGLTPAEIRAFLGVDRPLSDTLLGMRRYGLVQRVGRGRYVAATL